MAEDIVTQLLDVVCWCNEFDGLCDACQAADEIKRLRRWKAEATAVLNRWDSLCGRTLEVVRIGDRKSDAMATYIESQKAEIERLRAELDAERALADQLAVALLGTASGRIIPTDDEWAGVVKMRSAALDAWEARRG